MTYSEIEISFEGDLAPSNYIGFDIDSPGLSPVYYTWVNLRSGANQVTTGTPNGTPGERTAINYVDAFNADHNPGDIFFEVSRIANTVTIKAKTPTFTFLNTFAQVSQIDNTPLVSPIEVTFVINNFGGAIYEITDEHFETATVNDACTHYKVSITTSEVTDSMSGDATIPSGNLDNPITFELNRGFSFSVDLLNVGGQLINLSKTTDNVPSFLDSGNIVVNIVGSPNGATLTATLPVSSVIDLEYSLDNIIWQSSNVFGGLLSGTYTLYIRDQFGCTISKSDILIDSFTGIETSYFHISKANSIRYANRITFGDCANYKTDENTLSCEVDVPFVYKEIQQFQSCDVITTQFRSNYTERLAVVIREDGTEDSITVSKKSNNRDLKDKRDAWQFDLGNGKTGIYFTGGNLYDYDSGLDIGDYTLNGLLPIWGVVGNYFKIDTTWYQIEGTVYDESRNVEALIISNNYTGVDVLVQVASIYNKFNYEVYEFTVDMVSYIGQNIQIRINNNHDVFENLTHLSEVINVQIRQEGTVEIRYKNNTNTSNIDYSTGIEHKLRLMVEQINGGVSDDSESYTTDTTAILLSADIHELDEFVFSPLTKGLMRKLVQALSHSDVYLDGVRYIKNANIEVEGALEETNLYDVKATMIKAGSGLSSQSGTGDNTFNEENIEVPGLIESDSGYVSY